MPELSRRRSVPAAEAGSDASLDHADDREAAPTRHRAEMTAESGATALVSLEPCHVLVLSCHVLKL